MAHTLAMDSREIALDLYGLLKDLDSARWRDELEDAVRLRLDEIQAHAAVIEDRFEQLKENYSYSDESLAALKDKLAGLTDLMAEYHPADGLEMPDVRQEWMDFRSRMQPAYENFAEVLREFEIHVPSLRPTNYARNIFHATSALLSLVLVELVLNPTWMLIIAFGIALSAWSMETGKRLSPRVDKITWWVFGKMGHPHERKRVNSATWFSTALLTLALTGSKLIAVVALVIMGLADPAAGLIGRRWGRIKLIHGRSLEGTATFVAVGIVASMAVLGIFHAELGLAWMLGLTACAVLPAALAELVAFRIDDNLLVPAAAAAGAGAFALVVGIPL